MDTLVLWEISRKQDYIFSSNRLQENRGASIIIDNIIEQLPNEVDENYKNNLVYNGGGSSLYSFDNIEDAKSFIKRISEKVLYDYPGVEVFMVAHEYNKKLPIIEEIEEAYKKLGVKKNQRKYSGRQKSFGIEIKDNSTGLPAMNCKKDPVTSEKIYYSYEIKAKLEESKKESKKFDELLPEDIRSIKSFRDLAKGDKNYLGVIHIDGNKMGIKFNQLKSKFIFSDNDNSKQNEEYLKALKIFSDNIKNAYENAFKKMANTIKLNEEKIKDITKIEEGKFPLIPIIIAGDDITFVVNGKIAIESAKVFLDELSKNEIIMYKDEKVPLNACSGIAIVKTSHPFNKAYELAESLCENAKRTLREEYPEEDYSLIDWHIEQLDIIGSIEEIREENYIIKDETGDKKLNMRPLYLNNKDTWRTYENFKSTIYHIENLKINDKKLARNKVKELRDVFREGKKSTELFLKSNNIENYLGGIYGTENDYGFNDNYALYYDAIETIDFYKLLETEE